MFFIAFVFTKAVMSTRYGSFVGGLQNFPCMTRFAFSLITMECEMLQHRHRAVTILDSPLAEKEHRLG